MGLILAIDQGTTGTTAVLVDDENFNFIGKSNKEFTQIFPAPGLVEHNLEEIWETIKFTITDVLLKASRKASEITSIGITNQRETICAFNNKGEQLHNAIVWQDRRTGRFCEELIKGGESDYIKKTCGLPVDPYFSGSKINWLLNNSNKIKEALSNEDLKFGTIDTYILFKLSNSESYFTDATNASRTMLYNIIESEWDEKLCKLIGVSIENLPIVKDSFSNFGVTNSLGFLPDGIPITGILGDQQSALFGQAGLKKGELKCTFGTGAFLLLNTGTAPFYSKNGLITTIAYREGGVNHYALEGSSYIAGAAVQWLRDNLGLFQNSPEIEKLANKVTNLYEMENLLFFPFFTGIGSPYWKSEATATITGLTRDTNKNHIALACLDGICLSIDDLIQSMKEDSGLDILELKVDGGAATNKLLMEIQATISKLEIIKPVVIETTAYGACLASAVGNNKISMKSITKLWKKDTSYKAIPSKLEHYSKKSKQWKALIKKIYL